MKRSYAEAAKEQAMRIELASTLMQTLLKSDEYDCVECENDRVTFTHIATGLDVVLHVTSVES